MFALSSFDGNGQTVCRPYVTTDDRIVSYGDSAQDCGLE